MYKNKTFVDKNIFTTIILLFLTILIIINPSKYTLATSNGIALWGKVILPTLLPFFFITKIINELNGIEKISKIFTKPMHKLFNCPGISAYVFLMSILSGYPMGAKIITDLYNSNSISQNDAKKMLSFCSTSGPMFVVGSVGVGMFCDIKVGLILIICHLLGAFLNGFIYRGKKEKELTILSYKTPSKNLLNDSMFSSINAVLMICGFMCIAFVVIEIINTLHLNTPLISLLNTILPHKCGGEIINGILEVTKGCMDISSLNLSLKYSLPITSFLIGFGGISIHLQSLIFIKQFNMSYKLFFVQKLTQGIISCAICFLVCLFI